MEKKELKIISLNTWGGKIKQPILDFFESNKDIDIFCLQGVYNNADIKTLNIEYTDDNLNLFNDIGNVLSNYNSLFRPQRDDFYGLAIFIKKDIGILRDKHVSIYKAENFNGSENYPSILQHIQILIKNEIINITHLHGLWTGKGKDDTEDRIKQSQNIIDFLKTLEGDIVLCGDFNLNPNTESIKMIEDFGLRNLIRENNIKSTRTSFYPKDRDSRFADYTFVSKGIEVKSFEIMPDEVSDHSPVRLIIEI